MICLVKNYCLIVDDFCDFCLKKYIIWCIICFYKNSFDIIGLYVLDIIGVLVGSIFILVLGGGMFGIIGSVIIIVLFFGFFCFMKLK